MRGFRRVTGIGTRPKVDASLAGFSLQFKGRYRDKVVELHRRPSWLRRRLFPYFQDRVRNYRRTTQIVRNEHGKWWVYEPVNGPR